MGEIIIVQYNGYGLLTASVSRMGPNEPLTLHLYFVDKFLPTLNSQSVKMSSVMAVNLNL